MHIWQAIVLGVVQGFTEFLPISSTGHLLLTEKLLGIPSSDLQFEVVVHLGTLAAVVWVFRRRVCKIARGALFKRIKYRKGKFRFTDDNTRLFLLLLLATLPAVLAGITVRSWISRNFHSPVSVGIMLLVTGGGLYGTRFIRGTSGGLNWFKSILIGLAQALALLPGISRSGVTIAAGLYSGVEKSRATEFSFLLLIPVVLGAGCLKIQEIVTDGITAARLVCLLTGAISAALFGYIAIRIILGIVRRNHLYYFAYYCWILGVGVLLLMR